MTYGLNNCLYKKFKPQWDIAWSIGNLTQKVKALQEVKSQFYASGRKKKYSENGLDEIWADITNLK